ncbi:MAG TPA: sugar O-acetyltransferase [Candidatus Faecalicoccus intestinipullorum]|nr:sugar O-acetyltransferase [Candidatus Faecalicoccus intestinipullorum]
MQRFDLRISDAQRKQEGDRTKALVFRLNGTDPSSQEYKKLLNELFVNGIPEGTKIHTPIYINLAKNITFGKRVSVMPYFKCMSAGKIVIEDDVRIAMDVKIITNNHDFYERDVLTIEDVHIQKNAWIGAGATILPGVTIGKNAIVGAGSVVTHDVLPNTVVVGNPARVIQTLDPDRFEKV